MVPGGVRTSGGLNPRSPPHPFGVPSRTPLSAIDFGTAVPQASANPSVGLLERAGGGLRSTEARAEALLQFPGNDRDLLMAVRMRGSKTSSLVWMPQRAVGEFDEVLAPEMGGLPGFDEDDDVVAAFKDYSGSPNALSGYEVFDEDVLSMDGEPESGESGNNSVHGDEINDGTTEHNGTAASAGSSLLLPGVTQRPRARSAPTPRSGNRLAASPQPGSPDRFGAASADLNRENRAIPSSPIQGRRPRVPALNTNAPPGASADSGHRVQFSGADSMGTEGTFPTPEVGARYYYKPRARFLSLPLAYDDKKMPISAIRFALFSGDQLLMHDSTSRTYLFRKNLESREVELEHVVSNPQWRSACALSENRFLLLKVGALEIFARSEAVG
ncbi:unnamed protein product [Amoebophrya sp. A25]|nr:unnamed protein product [Amoebophrya sp. A25]|eukprot:GSA25T00015297001.1